MSVKLPKVERLRKLTDLDKSEACYNLNVCKSSKAVCPAGWKPGDKTMKPDVQGSKEYFKNT